MFPLKQRKFIQARHSQIFTLAWAQLYARDVAIYVTAAQMACLQYKNGSYGADEGHSRRPAKKIIKSGS